MERRAVQPFPRRLIDTNTASSDGENFWTGNAKLAAYRRALSLPAICSKPPPRSSPSRMVSAGQAKKRCKSSGLRPVALDTTHNQRSFSRCSPNIRLVSNYRVCLHEVQNSHRLSQSHSSNQCSVHGAQFLSFQLFKHHYMKCLKITQKSRKSKNAFEYLSMLNKAEFDFLKLLEYVKSCEKLV